MKVLVIPTWLPGDADNLIGIYHKEYTEMLNKNGIEADILYVDRQRLSKPFKYFFSKKTSVEKETNYDIYKHKILDITRFSYDLEMKKYVKALDKLLVRYIKEKGKPDVLHAQVTLPAGYATCVVGEKHGIPVVVTEHTSKFERFFNQEPYNKYGMKVLNTSYFTTVSEFMKNSLSKFTSKCEILPNQVDVNLFKNDVQRIIKDDFKIVSVCALREGKGIDVAIKAVKELLKEGINVQYNIVGDGFMEEYYKNVALEEGISGNVKFLGRKSKKEIAEILKDSHVLLIPSRIETFAIPGIEAFASGMPVVSTECKGPEEFIDKKCGDLCAVDDVEDMADSIKYVYEEYEKFDRKHMLEVAEAYSEESVCKKAKEIYESLIK